MTDANLAVNSASAGIPPMPFGVALERIYRILRDHMKVFLGIAIVPAVAMMLLYGVMMGVMFAYIGPYLPKNGLPPANPDPATLMRVVTPVIAVAIFAFMIPMMAVMSFYVTAAFHASNKIDSGIGTSVRESYSIAWQRIGRSLGLLIWIYFKAFWPALAILCAIFGSFGWAVLATANHTPPSASWAIIPLLYLLYFVAYVYGIIVALRLSLAFPAWMEEGLTAREAMRRSAQLTYGSKGRIFLLVLVIHLISYAFFMLLYIVGLLVFAIAALAMSAMQVHPTNPLIIVAAVIGGMALLCFLFVWMAMLYGSIVVTLSVVYHDQRRRKDAALPARLHLAEAELPSGAEPA
jgi:hypothetical protein